MMDRTVELNVSGQVDHLHQHVKEKKRINTVLFDDERVEEWMKELIKPFDAWGFLNYQKRKTTISDLGLESFFYVNEWGASDGPWFYSHKITDRLYEPGGKTYLPYSKELVEFLREREKFLDDALVEAAQPFVDELAEEAINDLNRLLPTAKMLFVGAEIDFDDIPGQKEQMIKSVLALDKGDRTENVVNTLYSMKKVLKEKIKETNDETRRILREKFSAEPEKIEPVKTDPTGGIADKNDFFPWFLAFLAGGLMAVVLASFS